MSGKNSVNAQISLYQGVGIPFDIIEAPIIQSDNSVLVSVTLATICGSDLHTVSGRRTAEVPCVLGHEVIGTIEASTNVCSTDGKPLNIGDRIVWSMTTSCGTCYYCNNKNIPQKCVDMYKYGHTQFVENNLLSGGFATHIHLREGTTIFHIPDTIKDVEAVPINCALTTVMNGLESIGTRSGENAIIHGAGMLGIYASCLLKEKGYNKIVIVDKNPIRLQIAKKFGATHTFNTNNTSTQEIQATTSDITDAKGFDLGIEVSGASTAIPNLLQWLGIGARCLTLGYVYPLENIEMNMHQLTTKCIQLQGVHNYNPKTLKSALHFVVDNQSKYPFTEIVGQIYPLSDIDNAFAHAFRQDAIRIAIQPMMN